jgi:molybdopterin converting factor small subunit
MRVTVSIGEPAWRKIGRKEVELEIPTGTTVGDMLGVLGQEYPDLRPFLQDQELPPTVFVGEQVVDQARPLQAEDRLALVWALAGGAG